ncbi:4-hydroxy-tetrahydrodipicolinate synthase [Pantoea sp. Ap-967]|uniref:4-hydroxy-tetrahydrodipicolinate synthase n=1 Tax=Pantoea sp. Ap-967 TaxID=2608362 RepID=UPI00142261C6|nr:4-hydroxy-tetrahydrodipicolinate synthase [Pantoea sp. Ap-967]NIE77149.1 4-hydroxy-tetrahydrodipicolinate synthase [Pantoea sp. Ap-967]
MSSFSGIWIALVTPFRSDEIDFDALERLVKKLIADGVAGFVVCGTTGEAAALSKTEQLSVLDAVLTWVQPSQVVMGLSGNNMREILSFQMEIQKREIAGLLVPAPCYIRPSQAGIESFFTAIADAASVPVIVYDIPYRTGARIDRETLRRIVQHPRIGAVKDCGGDSETTMALIQDGHAQVLAGEDSQLFNSLCLGGAGAISASAHVRADLYVKMQRQLDEGDVSGGRETFYRLLPWMQMAFAEPNPAVVKAALEVEGILDGGVREPMQPCTSATRQRLIRVLSVLDI